ncbi:hypothetical protein H4CHR_04425 [Variovorax sp. PBS-H4]|uniref:hypothetical protein n=1 Tax=Variovorax sp. PBS-H4 TaxID=434008 RepID=UPI001315C161|nr:hypothetical protein [Variovorax sp. PBS-H4]VTU38439.1 hypothetical protein H4CHR_04425 [Variovorax sp. PBS-H4]
MTAQSKDDSLTLQPIDAVVPRVRHFDGRFTFVRNDRDAANEARIARHNYIERDNDGRSDWNVGMFLSSLCVFLPLLALIACLVFLAGVHVGVPLVRVLVDEPTARGYALVSLLVLVLSLGLALRLRRLAPTPGVL